MCSKVKFPPGCFNICVKMLTSLPFADHVEGLTEIDKNSHKLELVPEKTHLLN